MKRLTLPKGGVTREHVPFGVMSGHASIDIEIRCDRFGSSKNT